MTTHKDPWCPRNCHNCRHVLKSGLCSVDLAAQGAMSRDEVADEMGISWRNVDVAILTATAKLAAKLTIRDRAWQRIEQLAA